MRLGGAAGDAFAASLSEEAESARRAYMEAMLEYTRYSKSSVMLGDGTVREEETFDPARVSAFYRRVAANLRGWEVQDVTVTHTDDKRRMFTKFSIAEGPCTLSGHLSLQYHVLLYYAPDHGVIDCQRELSDIVEQARGDDERAARVGDAAVRERLELMGKAGAGDQEVFEVLYNDAALRDDLAAGIDAALGERSRDLAARKAELLRRLDGYLTEVYRTSHVLIDEARLVGGEEGHICSLDLDGSAQDASDGERRRVAGRVREFAGAISAARAE